MNVTGTIIATSPIYRGNSRKTLFTRDGDGKQRIASLAGEIQGTAQHLMDAFIGKSRNGKNIGLINQLWLRLYGRDMPQNLIRKVSCVLKDKCYPQNKLFDLRMGISLDEDRWAAVSNANYKMETVIRNSEFDFTMTVDDGMMKKDDNSAKLYYILEEMKSERFWFGAGKSKGMGRLCLKLNKSVPKPDTPPSFQPKTNHLKIEMTFDGSNPVLVGWNWGKVDPHTPAASSVEARLLIGAMRSLPNVVRERLEMALSGTILKPEDWKDRFSEHLPRMIAIWLAEKSGGEAEFWTLPAAAFKKLSKGKHALNKKVLKSITPLVDKTFNSKEEAQKAFTDAIPKANMVKRVVKLLEFRKEETNEFNLKAWDELAETMGIGPEWSPRIEEAAGDEFTLAQTVSSAIETVLPNLFDQVDQHIKMLRSDSWVDAEIESREEHLQIKKMLKAGEIQEYQWNDTEMVPEGVRPGAWREFIESHSRVQYRHMLNSFNLNKSITSDISQIELLKQYREKTRQELSQPHHIDFRAGGPGNREISQKYGKPYDTLFMRMLSWRPSSGADGSWEAFIPGSTIKGAFRKRASQVLKTLWGEGRETDNLLSLLFGRQGQRGLIFFSDAYLADPENTDKAWCSIDGICMDPKTGQPIETSKRDYLYAYGKQLTFNSRMDLQDLNQKNLEAVNIFFHLLKDFQQGDIPVGGKKTSGFGWVEAKLQKLEWLTGKPGGIGKTLFGENAIKPAGPWHMLTAETEDAAGLLTPLSQITPKQTGKTPPPTARAGFISHRSFGGHCGILSLEAEVLTPVSVRESGEPSFTTQLDNEPVNGWDFFSFSPPETENRPEGRQYAIPGQSLKGMVRHIYSIAVGTNGESSNIGSLTPVDSLFGWVGDQPNQALMGRLVFDFVRFDAPVLSWFKAPYPYGRWEFTGNEWKKSGDGKAARHLVAKNRRLFPHAPLAPIVESLDAFEPDTVQARYFRAIQPGSKARTQIRFWNLGDEEFKRLLWSIILEPGLAHKAGSNRYLGFGSLRLNLLPDSYFVDWSKRYAGKAEDQWKQAIDPGEFITPDVIKNYQALKKGLNADAV